MSSNSLQLFDKTETKLSTAGWTVVGLLLHLVQSCTCIYMAEHNKVSLRVTAEQ